MYALSLSPIEFFIIAVFYAGGIALLREYYQDVQRTNDRGDAPMNVDILNHYIWYSALQLVQQHAFFVINNDEGTLTLRKSEGFSTTFVWLIPADHLSESRMKRELDDTLTWMSAYRRKTPSFLFRSIHLFLFSRPLQESDRERIARFSAQTLIGRYQSSAWAIDIPSGQVFTPSLLLRSSRMLKNTLAQAAKSVQQQSLQRHLQGADLYEQIGQWQQEIGRGQTVKQQTYQKSVRHSASAPITFTIAAINVVVWVLMTVYGGSQDPAVLRLFGAKDNARIIAGEYWRFITPMFLHIGGLHLWFNSIALLSLGGHVERMYGSLRFIPIYFIAGFFGTYASFMFSPHLSAGASGAIFGLFGALLFFATKNPSVFGHTMGPGLISALGINLVLGFLIPGIDNYAHLGGLLGGFIAAFLIGLPRQQALSPK